MLPRADFPELGAGDDAFEGGGDAAVAGAEFGGDVFDEGFVGELDAAAEGDAEELAEEMRDEVVAARGMTGAHISSRSIMKGTASP